MHFANTNSEKNNQPGSNYEFPDNGNKEDRKDTVAAAKNSKGRQVSTLTSAKQHEQKLQPSRSNQERKGRRSNAYKCRNK